MYCFYICVIWCWFCLEGWWWRSFFPIGLGNAFYWFGQYFFFFFFFFLCGHIGEGAVGLVWAILSTVTNVLLNLYVLKFVIVFI